MSAYSLGLPFFRFFLRTPLFARFFTPLARIWLRQYRWQAHLQAFQFDGVVDGGANIGEFASVVREALPGAHLLCVEPHPECASQLRRQGFEVVEAALWNEKACMDLFQDGPSTSSTLLRNTPGCPVAKVETVRLGDLPICGKRLLIKLDLQGAEPVALQALGDLEKRCAGFLVEVSLVPGGTFEELNRLFLSKNYLQFASVNELFSSNRQIEADILWIKKEVLQEIFHNIPT